MLFKTFTSRTFRYGAVSTLITILTVCFVILLNILITALSKKYPWDWDLTENQIFQLSQDTKNFLATLDQKVEIYVMNTETGFIQSHPAAYFTQAQEIIRKFAQGSPSIQVSYVDILRNPTFYAELSLKANDVLVVSGEQYRKIQGADLFTIGRVNERPYIAASKAEQTLSSALVQLTAARHPLAVVIRSAGEESLAPFTTLLEGNAFQVVEQNLLTGEIPEEAALVLLAAPNRDLTPGELRKLDDFLEREGLPRTFFYLASITQPELPNLESFLEEWGIAIYPGVVFETDPSRIRDSVYIAWAEYAENRFAKADGLLPVIPQARPLGIRFEAERYRTVQTLLRFSPNAGIRPAHAGPQWQPTLENRAPHVPVLLLSSSRRSSPSGDPQEAHILVCGSFLALNENLLGSPTVGNGGYFLDLVKELSGQTLGFRIQDKTFGFTELGASLDQVMILGSICMGILPLGFLVSGLAVWIRRRHG